MKRLRLSLLLALFGVTKYVSSMNQMSAKKAAFKDAASNNSLAESKNADYYVPEDMTLIRIHKDFISSYFLNYFTLLKGLYKYKDDYSKDVFNKLVTSIASTIDRIRLPRYTKKLVDGNYLYAMNKNMSLRVFPEQVFSSMSFINNKERAHSNIWIENKYCEIFQKIARDQSRSKLQKDIEKGVASIPSDLRKDFETYQLFGKYPNRIPRVTQSMLFRGENISVAGQLRINGGQIIEIDANSEDYRLDNLDFKEVLKDFISQHGKEIFADSCLVGLFYSNDNENVSKRRFTIPLDAFLTYDADQLHTFLKQQNEQLQQALPAHLKKAASKIFQVRLTKEDEEKAKQQVFTVMGLEQDPMAYFCPQGLRLCKSLHIQRYYAALLHVELTFRQHAALMDRHQSAPITVDEKEVLFKKVYQNFIEELQQLRTKKGLSGNMWELQQAAIAYTVYIKNNKLPESSPEDIEQLFKIKEYQSYLDSAKNVLLRDKQKQRDDKYQTIDKQAPIDQQMDQLRGVVQGNLDRMTKQRVMKKLNNASVIMQ